MVPARRLLLSATSLLLGLLVLLLGVLAARQEAPAVATQRTPQTVKTLAVHTAQFRKLSGRHCAKHPTAPIRKHHRSRVHRPGVAKVAVPIIYRFVGVAAIYVERPVLPLTGVYRYLFFREITPPPPKDC